MAGAPRERLNGNGSNGHSNGHAKANGNGHSNGHTLSIATLQAEIARAKQRLQELTAERATFALAAISNDTMAIARVAEIDAERQRLASRNETLESAVRQLHRNERQDEWRKFLPAARAIHGYEFRQAAEVWPARIARLLVGRQSHDLTALANALAELDQLEADTARLAAGRALPDRLFRTTRIAGEPSDPADSYRRNQEERQRVEALVVEELLADTSSLRRPRELEQAIVDARHRLAVEGANGRAVRAHPRVSGVIGRVGG